MNAKQWINFVRLYGPIPTKDNLYDENLRRQARRKGIQQILFKHPFEAPVMGCFDPATASAPQSSSLGRRAMARRSSAVAFGRSWEGMLIFGAGRIHTVEHEVQLPSSAAGGARKIRLHVLRDLERLGSSPGR